MQTQDLKDKIAVITGGAQGIGAATAQLLAQHGATVVIADKNIQEAEKTAQEIQKWGQAGSVSLDVACPESVSQMVEQVIKKWSRIDILVNNAGIIGTGTVDNITVNEWDYLMDINLRGNHLCSQGCIKGMLEQKSGRIVNIASMAGQVGGIKAGPHYSASKAGIICLTKTYARFGAPFVNVNSICPGLIDTPMTSDRKDDPDSVLLKRLGTAQDVANVVYFLSAPLSSYITGANIDVNGGMYMFG